MKSSLSQSTAIAILQGCFCGHCGLWIPKGRQTEDKNRMPYCSKGCRKKEVGIEAARN